MRQHPERVPTFRERVLELVEDSFAIGQLDQLPKRMEELLKTQDTKLPKDRTWIFDPGGLEIKVTFAWEEGVTAHRMRAYLKVLDKGTILPSSCILASGDNINITKGYWDGKHIRGGPNNKLMQKIDHYYEDIKEQYNELIDPGELEIKSKIYTENSNAALPPEGTFPTSIWLEEPGWFRRRMIFVCTQEDDLDTKIDPFHEDSEMSTQLSRNCKSKESAERWIAKVTRKLEQKHAALCPKGE